MKKQYLFNKIFGLLLCLGMTMAAFNSCGDKNFWKIEEEVQVTNITINPPGDVSIAMGESITLTASVKPDNATNKNITWYSENDNIAIVDWSGYVRGISAGTTTIYAKADDGSGAVAAKSVTVTSGSD